MYYKGYNNAKLDFKDLRCEVLAQLSASALSS